MDFNEIGRQLYNAYSNFRPMEAKRIYLSVKDKEIIPMESDLFYWNIQRVFDQACSFGDLEIAQWIHSMIGSKLDLERAFFDAICGDQCEVADWLLSLKPDMDISRENDFYFRRSCAYGLFRMAQWIFEKRPNVNIAFNNYDAFREACLGGYTNIIEWLLTIFPTISLNKKLDKYLTMIPIHILQVAKNRSLVEYSDCIICETNKADFTISCSHQFCHECIFKWAKIGGSCPICRSELSFLH